MNPNSPITQVTSNPQCGVSWNGFNVFGDEASIREILRLIHLEGRANDLQQILLDERNARSKGAGDMAAAEANRTSETPKTLHDLKRLYEFKQLTRAWPGCTTTRSALLLALEQGEKELKEAIINHVSTKTPEDLAAITEAQCSIDSTIWQLRNVCYMK